MSRTCVFVDGGYFQKVLEKEFDRAPIDFARLGTTMAQGFEPYLRTYYYNCTPYQSNVPTEQERSLFANAERFYASLRRVPNLQLRMGRLAFRGISQDTRLPIFEQKRVDVQLAVDLVTLAFSRQIATAAVMAGDSDFIPAVNAAKDQGVRVVLYSSIRNPAHRDLLAAADERRLIDASFIGIVRRAPNS